MNILLRIVLFPLLIILGILGIAIDGIAGAVGFITKPLAFLCLIGTVTAFFMLNVQTGILFGFITLMVYILPYGIDWIAYACAAIRDGIKDAVY